MKKAVFYFLLFSFVLIPVLTNATNASDLCQRPGSRSGCPSLGLVPCGNVPTCPCCLCDFFVMLRRIYNFVLWTLIPPVAALILVYGGFLYITAYLGMVEEGGPSSIEKANKLFKYVGAGLLIVYGAHLFITLLLTIIGWQWGEWWKICPGYQ